MDNTKLTLDYYNATADEFTQGTQNVDFSASQTEFLKYIPKGGKILDLGCGAGRDSKAFKDAGFQVVAVDGSKELCKKASDFIGQNVICATFQEYVPEEQFDGIWACASLLHLNEVDMKTVINRLTTYLKPTGCWYISLKCENFEGIKNGRFFKSMTKDTFVTFMKQFPNLKIDKILTSNDVRPGRENELWVNAFIKKQITP